MKDQSNPTAGEQSAKDDSLSEHDLIAQWSQEGIEDDPQPDDDLLAESEEETDEEEAESDELEVTDEAEESEEEEEESEGDPDFENWTPEQLQAAAKKAKSRLLSDLGKLRKENRELKELQAHQRQPEPNPLEKATKVENAAVAALQTVDDLRKFKDEAEQLEEWAQAHLDANGGADPEDVIATLEGGKNFTKAQLVAMRNRAKATLKKDIPARLLEIQSVEQAKAHTEHFDAQIAVQIPEYAKEKSPVAARHRALMEDPTIKAAFDSNPALRAVGGLILAHAARSIALTEASKKSGQQPAATGATKKAKPPSSPSGAAAAAPAFKSDGGKGKRIEAARARYEASGAIEDLVALEALEQS